jgi:hypothetical protein
VRSLEARRSKVDDSDAIDAINDTIRQIRRYTPAEAAFCLVLDGLFTGRNVELNYVGKIAEIENELPQIGLIFDKGLKLKDVVSTLAVSLSPALAKIAAGTVAATVLLTAINPLLGVAALVGGVILYDSVSDLDVEKLMCDEIQKMEVEISGYVRRAIERITDHGAMALEVGIVSGGPAANNRRCCG